MAMSEDKRLAGEENSATQQAVESLRINAATSEVTVNEWLDVPPENLHHELLPHRLCLDPMRCVCECDACMGDPQVAEIEAAKEEVVRAAVAAQRARKSNGEKNWNECATLINSTSADLRRAVGALEAAEGKQ